MPPIQETEQDAISEQVLQQLSQTAYACSSLHQLSSRPGNFVYRGILVQPFTTQDEDTATSIIIKHSTNPVAINQDAPVDLLRSVYMDFPPLLSTL